MTVRNLNGGGEGEKNNGGEGVLTDIQTAIMDPDKVMLQVEAIGARELFKGRFTNVDPYLKLRLGTTGYQTVTAKGTTDPVWGSTHIFDFASETDELVAEVWDAELVGSDALLGVARTSIQEIRKGQEEALALGRREVETFFHLVPADSKESTWISSVIERTVKAGAEALGGVSNVWKKTYSGSSSLEEPRQIPSLVVQHPAAAAVTPPQIPQGRLYLKFRIDKLKNLQVKLPHVVPPAAIPLSTIREAPKKTLREWAEGARPPNRMFRIICLDGGGVRGVLTAGILRRLVKSGRFPKLLQDADLIAGTSTGGILALLFAAGYTPAQAQALYTHHCSKIFLSSPSRRYSPFIAKFDPSYLESMMRVYFQDLRVEELPLPIMVTAFRIRARADEVQKSTFYKSGGKSWRPALFSNMPQYNGPVGPDDSLCADVACRTSAAPTYFPSYQNYVDGAIYANNPVLCAIAKVSAHLRHVHPGKIAVLSLGSGKFDYFIPEEKEKGSGGREVQDWGLRQWAPFLRSILLDSSAISLDTNMQLLMGDRYHRINPYLPRDIDLDDYTSIPELNIISRQYPLKESEDWIREVYYKTWTDEAG